MLCLDSKAGGTKLAASRRENFKIPERPPVKRDLLVIFQRRMICWDCATQRHLLKSWQNSNYGCLFGECQTCGEGNYLREVMCMR